MYCHDSAFICTSLRINMCTSFEMMLNVFLNYVNLVFLLPYQVIYHYKQETYCVISIQVIKGVEVKVFVIIKFSNIIVFL